MTRATSGSRRVVGTALRALVASAAILLVAASAALASPEDVRADYDADGVIDQQHSIADLRAALTELQGTSIYATFADAVQAELNERIGGVSPRPPTPVPRASGDEAESASGSGSGTTDPSGGAQGATGSAGGSSGSEGSLTEQRRAERRSPGDDAPGEAGGDSSAAEDGSVDPDTASALSADEELPQPPTVAADESVPLVFVAFSIAAVILLLAGIGSAIYRRAGARRG